MHTPFFRQLYSSGFVMVFLFVLSAIFLPSPAGAQHACCCNAYLSDCIEVPAGGSCDETGPYPKSLVADVKGGADCTSIGKEAGKFTSWVSAVINEELIPSGCTSGGQTSADSCTIWDMLRVVVNITKIILALLGSAAFAMFVYGGLVWLMAAGNQERVNKGRQIITNAALGILVVLVSYTAINLLVSAMTAGRGGIGSIANIFNQQWNKGP